jgi:hypothetical protein
MANARERRKGPHLSPRAARLSLFENPKMNGD